MWGKRGDMAVRHRAPFNAEPPSSVLAAAEITALDTFYSRNHGAIPDIRPHQWRLTVVGVVDKPVVTFTLPDGLRLAMDGDNVATRVFRTSHAARMDSHDNAPGTHAARIRELGIRSAVGVPITVDGRVWGAAIVGSQRSGPLPSDTEARVGDFADLVATAIANAATRAELIASRARRRLERDLHNGACRVSRMDWMPGEVSDKIVVSIP
jgi:transcriptional regulator with GAF, ATPase, and Fis domain